MLIYLPILYIAAQFLYRRSVSPKTASVVTYVFEIAAFIKYFLIPLLILLDEEYIFVRGPVPSDKSLELAVKITIYEMMLIYFLRYIYIKKKLKNIRLTCSSGFRYEIASLLPVITIIGFVLLLLFPDLMLPKLYIFGEKDAENEQMVATFSILVSLWKKLFYILSIIYVYKKFQCSIYSKRKSVLYSFFLFFLIILFTLSSSRWSVLFMSISTFMVLASLYGKIIKRIAFTVFPLLISVLVLITLYKFQDKFDALGEVSIQSFAIILASQLQAYFSGVSLIAQSIDMSTNAIFANGFTYNVLLNDFAGSVPILNKFINPMERTNIYFNQYVIALHTEWFTQIIPSSGIGYIYFGFWLSPLFTVLFNITGLHFERKCFETNDIFDKFIFIFISLWCSLSICFNTQIPFGNIITGILPLYIINILYKKYKL